MTQIAGPFDAATAGSALSIPPGNAQMTVGLFGGSFNPPHDGHRLVAETAVKRLGLTRIWWIVTPGNPLKNHNDLATLDERIAMVQKFASPSRADVTAFEARYKVRFTADALALIQRRRPDMRIVWVMGADSMATFHRWQEWQKIAETVPIAVVDRPGETFAALSSPFARRYAAARVPQDSASILPYRKAPAWTFLFGPRSGTSSTRLRGEAHLSS
ncbi:nicotinate-nucleotide adenylyltransferase [Jiella pelagia]|uniref:Probable nicotinate-nucleotide adenylyltransferase n=1 Tax=Jiella pelagia TaxID=2986949 RepID=A0ABY7BWZ8_9HYPH|nr:nicotinate-nucleotide adenylyltransferase [Jiella pelagia]WAP67913.1 nicotinate-nucleotide adenylyltransferase [Jiella pelagia]